MENSSGTAKKRNSNIEWLRILSMFLIIAYHGIRTFDGQDQPIFVYSYTVLFGSWGILGVDLFLIISAWFLSAQKFRMTKVIHVVFQVFTWVCGYVAVYFVYRLGFCHWGLKDALLMLFKQGASGFFQPLWSSYYWFVTAYVFMLLLSPLMNRALQKLDKKTVSRLLLLFLFIPVYSQFPVQHTYEAVGDIVYFLYVYMLVGYIRLYGSKLLQKYAKPQYYGLLIAAVVLIRIVSHCFFEEGPVQKLMDVIACTDRFSMVMLAIALLVFYRTKEKKPTYSKIVNWVGAYTLGVYLFHENQYLELPNTLDYVFRKLSAIGVLKPDMLFPVKHLLVVAAIFIIGTALEWIRNAVLQKPFMSYITKRYAPALEKADRLFNNEYAQTETEEK